MPSIKHEALVLLFRNRPELAPELLRDALHTPLPAYTAARIESAELTDIQPAEYRADLVVLLVDDKPVLGIIVEVQLAADERKRFVWPVYVSGLRARLECPACVLVITSNERVARWCREPIDLGPGNVFTLLVVGPASVPVIDDEAAAKRDPELAVLSCIAHGSEANAGAVGVAALTAVMGLSDEKKILYSDLVFAALSEAALAALEELMNSGNYEFQSEFARTHQAKGRAEGREEGLAKGRAEGRAEALLAVLESRGLRVSNQARARILECTDGEQLDAWLRRAVSVASVDELLLS